MIEITTIKGDKYSYDETNQRIYKNNILLTSAQAEPVFSNITDDQLPRFSGIYLKDNNSIVTLSGKINPTTDINSIS